MTENDSKTFNSYYHEFSVHVILDLLLSVLLLLLIYYTNKRKSEEIPSSEFTEQ